MRFVLLVGCYGEKSREKIYENIIKYKKKEGKFFDRRKENK
jgi:hypothetical protein